MSEALAVLVVGCGSIAGGYDIGPDEDCPPLTHAGAYARHGGFRLAGCVEPDEARRMAFMHKWRIPSGWATLEDVPNGCRFDVVSLCSPTPLHADHVAGALELRPGLLFCEKPLTPQADASRACVQACRQAGVLMAVNHTRRWAPDVLELRARLHAGELGIVRSAAGLYNKGVLNNGSHLVDLVHHLLGELEVAAAVAPVDDGPAGDPSVSALLTAAGGQVPVHLRTAHADDYAVFELELVTSRGLVTMEEGGFAWRERGVRDSPDFPGYRTLATARHTPGRYREAMLAAVDNIRSALLHGQALRSTGDSALQAQLVCQSLLDLARPGARA